MPYLLLVIGVLVGLYALYRFFVNADVQQVKALFLTTFFVIIAIALLILSLTGRLPAALALLGAMVPFGIAYMRDKHKSNKNHDMSDVIDVTPIEEDEDADKDEDEPNDQA